MKSLLNLPPLLCALVFVGWCHASAQSSLPAPPPSAPAKLSAADLQRLTAPIALYPDPLIATLLPASVYPLEIVQAARFVANTNNLAKLDEQPWDENVKAVARVPALIQKMDTDLAWTTELGAAFLAQDKDLMDAIQALRLKAETAGTLQTTPQQIVTVTNLIVEKTVEQQIVVVTNTIVQIQPASSTVVYVPIYNPYTVYYPPPAYVYNPLAPLVSFGVGIAVGAIIANNCDWRYGGCYRGNVNINVNNNYNRNVNVNNNVNRNVNANNNVNRAATTGQKWQPDQSRLNKSGAPSATTREARGWSGAATQPAAAARPTPSTGAVGSRPSTGTATARPTTGAATARPSTGSVGTRPTTGTATTRPATGAAGGQTSTWGGSASRPSASPSVNRAWGGSGGSAFGGMSSGANARSSSNRGAVSRGGGGGGARGGGGRR